MRYGIVTTSYPRTPGEPAGNFVLEFNEWLLRQGHQIEVVAAGTGDEDDSWQPAPTHRVRAAKDLFYGGGAPERLRESRRAALQAADFSARLTAALRQRAQRWDSVIAHWLAPSVLAAAIACRKLPICGIAHSGDVHLLERMHGVRAAARFLDRPNITLCFVSEDLRRRFLSKAGASARSIAARAIVCPMGIDARRFAEDLSPPDIAPPSVLFLGRLVPIKGVDVLLAALARMPRPPAIQIAGSGPEEAALKLQAESLGLAVQWLGEVRGAARDALLKNATVVVIPSRPLDGRSEGTPVVALEALAAGARLVVSGTGGLLELPESMCTRVPPGDTEKLREAVTRELDKGGRAPSSVRRWAQSFDWEVVGPKILG